MGRRFIRWEPKNGRFYCCHQIVTLQLLGAHLTFALSRGEKVRLPFKQRSLGGGSQSWSVMVEPAYVEQMLRFVAANGWFWDEVPEFPSRQDSDHDFDPANITPGMNWKLVTEMRVGADALDQQARRFELEADWSENRRWRKKMLSQVVSMRSGAEELRVYATNLLLRSVPV